VAILFAASGLVLLNGGSPPVNPTPEPGASGYDWAAPQRHHPNPDSLAVGVTHAQYSVDAWGNQSAVESARQVLTATATYQNQHIFGWGTLNPEPAPGVYNWTSLDQRMELIRSTGGTPVITLCCAPDWMKGGRAGETDWNRLHAAPLPEHYADFAALAVAVAHRYPDVRHFLVWNEMKGFWDGARNRWDYESYTRLYNIVYDALKAADPGVAVGGPYVVVEAWTSPEAGGFPSAVTGACGTVDRRGLDVLDYWLRHKRGADFVAVDGSVVTRDAGPLASTRVSSSVFGAITRWLRHRTTLPIWWSEFHVGEAGSDGQQRLVASAVAALLYMADEGASVALYWQPQHGADQAHGVGSPALWSSTEVTGGGSPQALAEAFARMQQVLAKPDGDLVSWPLPEVGVLHGREELLVVNTAEREVTVRIQGVPLVMAPYEVRYLRLPPGTAPGPPEWWRPAVDECLHEQPQPTG
jgi:hypothetical protein